MTTRSAKQAKNDQNDDTIQVTISQPTLAATTEEPLVSQLHPVGAVQTQVSWPPIQGPDYTNSTLAMQQALQIWPSMWNPSNQSYMSTLQPPQVPWMTTGVTPAQQFYPWQTPQPTTTISTKYCTSGYPITNTSVRDYYNTTELHHNNIYTSATASADSPPD